MKEIPILLNGDNVRAILEGRKTQIRKPIKHDAHADCPYWDKKGIAVKSPFGKPGDLLWVRETAKYRRWGGLWSEDSPRAEAEITYCADGAREWRILCRELQDEFVSGKRPSIHMPYWASRISLRVKSVRIERVQDITEDNLKAEGMESVRAYFKNFSDFDETLSDRSLFEIIWDATYARRSFVWSANPWVWVAEFDLAESEVQS